MLKKIVFLILFFSFSVLQASEKVKWYSFNDGVKLAKKENKHILVDFYASWCHWCKVMDEKTFSDNKIALFLNKNYICIRINTENREKNIKYRTISYTGQEFFQLIGGRGLPTILFMNSKADMITTIPGYVEKDVFLPISKFINEKCYLRSVSFEDYKSGKVNCNKKN